MILSPLEWMIAGRYLRTRRRESFIAVIIGFSLVGIALGVAALIVITSVMNGVREEMLRHFVGLSGHVQLYSRTGQIEDYTNLAKEIAKIQGVTRATPLIEDQVMLSSGQQARGAQIRAVPPGAIKEFDYLKERLIAGEWQNFEQGNGLLIGERLARTLNLGVGDKLTIISPEGRQTVVGLIPRMKTYPIIGVFKFGMHAIDASLVVMPFDSAQSFFKLADTSEAQTEGRVTGLEIRVDNLDQAAEIAALINNQLDHGFRAISWQQSNAAVFEALNVQRAVMFLILTLIILVAVFNIISSLIMLVKDKQRDIAVLRSIGVSRNQIKRIFVLCGTTIGAVGTFIGVSLGLVISWNVDSIRLWVEDVTGQPLLGEQLYFLASLPAEVDMTEVFAVVAMALVLSFLSTLYPAHRAAKQDPAEALRYE